jgi:hypothetical protein
VSEANVKPAQAGGRSQNKGIETYATFADSDRVWGSRNALKTKGLRPPHAAIFIDHVVFQKCPEIKGIETQQCWQNLDTETVPEMP